MGANKEAWVQGYSLAPDKDTSFWEGFREESAYLTEIGRNGNLKGWPFRPIVDALEILHTEHPGEVTPAPMSRACPD